MSIEVIVTIVSKLGYFTYLGDEINLLILGLGHLVTKYQQDIPVPFKRHRRCEWFGKENLFHLNPVVVSSMFFLFSPRNLGKMNPF